MGEQSGKGRVKRPEGSRAREESLRRRLDQRDELLPRDGWQQTAALLIKAVAVQKFSDDRGASAALQSLREIRTLVSVWLGANQDMDPCVREMVDAARVQLSKASQWLEDCDWMVARQKKGRKPARGKGGSRGATPRHAPAPSEGRPGKADK